MTTTCCSTAYTLSAIVVLIIIRGCQCVFHPPMRRSVLFSTLPSMAIFSPQTKADLGIEKWSRICPPVHENRPREWILCGLDR